MYCGFPHIQAKTSRFISPPHTHTNSSVIKYSYLCKNRYITGIHSTMNKSHKYVPLFSFQNQNLHWIIIVKNVKL